MRAIPVLLLALLAAAPARDRVPPAVPDGGPVSCVPIVRLRESRVRDDRTIDFMTGARRGYRVVLPQACPELGFEQRFTYETSLSQLCSTDIITVLHEAPVMRGASCGLAPFQPVVFPERQKTGGAGRAALVTGRDTHP